MGCQRSSELTLKTQPSLRLPQWYKSPSVDTLSARSWLLTVHHDSLVRDFKMYLSSMALLPRSSEEKRDSLTQPLPGSRTDNQSRKAANSRLSLKIPTLSPLSSPTATKQMSVPTPAKLTTNSVKLSIPPRSSLKSPPRSKKDQPTVPSRSDPLLPSPPPSPETPNQRSAGPRTAKTSKKTTTLPTTSTVNPPPLLSPTSQRRTPVNTRSTARTTKDSTTPSPPLPSHNFLLRFVTHILSSSLLFCISTPTLIFPFSFFFVLFP